MSDEQGNSVHVLRHVLGLAHAQPYDNDKRLNVNDLLMVKYAYCGFGEQKSNANGLRIKPVLRPLNVTYCRH